MLGGAVLNASTFIGGSYLAKYLSGTKTDQERRRHDKALERYQRDYAKYQENRQKLLDWQEQNRHEDAISAQNFENTDEALKLYNKFHPDENMQINEPVFSDYYRPSKEQKIGEMAYVSGGMMVLGYAASRWLYLWSALRVKDSRLKNLRFPKVSNLKMADYDEEIPFGVGVSARGVDPDTENPFDTGAVNPGYDETGEMNEMDRFPSSSSRRGSEDTTYHRTRGETSFIEGIDEHTPLITKETKRDEAWVRIKRKFPNINPANSSFTATLDEYDRVEVRLKRDRGKYHLLFNSDGEVNEKLPKTITNVLGTPAEDIIRVNEEEISRREKKIDELKDSRETASENQREQIDAVTEEQQNEISRLEAENEIIEERMSLRDRVKLIFKKYGFTVFAVVSAVGLVIGVIVSNLQKGLTSLGKGVGGALKNIGKKIGEILPGMIGAIASFVFKTAGEAVGFLAKHAWLLILAAVTIMIENLKKK